MATNASQALQVHGGYGYVADFPVVTLSAVEGTAYYADGDPAATGREVSGLVLWVIDAAGKPVAHARTEADGYFLFEQLKPGDYRIALDGAQATNLKIRLAQPVSLHLGPRGSNPRVNLKVLSGEGVGAAATATAP